MSETNSMSTLSPPSTPMSKSAIFLPTSGASPAIKPIPLNSPSTFKPSMESSAIIRNKACSSNYGKETAKSKTADRTPKAKDEKEIEQLGDAAFKPKLIHSGVGLRIKSSAMSSGYGKGVAVVKKKRAPATPTFQPDPSITGKSKKKEVMSSGYGKGIVEKRAPPKADLPSFTPDMDVSAAGSRMRKNVISRHAEPRPSTANKDAERPRTGGAPLRHTLAADREPKTVGGTPAAPIADVPFVVDAESYGAKAKYFGEKSAWTVAGDGESSIKEMAMHKAITANATSHKYGTEYTPPVTPRAEKESVAVAFVGGVSASTWVDSPDKLPTAPTSAKVSSAIGAYGEGSYQPKVGPKSEIEPTLASISVSATSTLVPVESLTPVTHTEYASKLKERVKGSYTQGAYTPPVKANAVKVEADLTVEDVVDGDEEKVAVADVSVLSDGSTATGAEELTEL